MAKLQSRQISTIVHVAVWAVLLTMPLSVAESKGSGITIQDYLRFLFVPLSFMVVFYTNYFRLIHRYLFSQHTTRFIVYNIMLIGGVMLLLHLLFHFAFPPPDIDHPAMERSWQDTARFLTGNVILYSLVMGVAVAIRMTGKWYESEAQRKEIEKNHTEAELQNLKSQLNPHFLFNTLNNIYSLIQIDASKAQDVVHDLSQLLRYVLYDSSQPTVLLKDEIGFLHNYIELMRIRLPRHVVLNEALPENIDSLRIAPLLFVSLVENAFKHGVSNEQPSHIDIVIVQNENSVMCSIINSYFPKSTLSDRSGSGIGLVNLRKRLHAIYPERYRLESKIENGEYHTVLQINSL